MKSTSVKRKLMLCGMAAFLFIVTGPWAAAFGAVLESKLTPTIVKAGQRFGDSVSISGDTAVIGAPMMNAHDILGQINIGYEFVRSAGTWTTQGRLALLPGTPGGPPYCATCHSVHGVDPPPPFFLYNSLNFQVDVSGDTAIAAIAAGGVGASPGYQVRISERSGDTWTETLAIQVSNGTVDSTSPIPVAVDNDTIAMGTTEAADVYLRSGGTWTVQQSVIPSDLSALTRFGHSLALSGNTMAVAGSSSSDNAVYVFIRSGSTWTQEERIFLPAGAVPVGAWFPVALSGDTLLIGAPSDGTAGTGAGAVYAYERSAGVWTQGQTLTASDATAGQAFGFSLAVDGDTAVIGAKTERAAYVFTRGGGTWSEQEKIIPPSGGAATFPDKFPISLSNNTLLIGASGDSEQAVDSGAAYVYDLLPEADLSLQKTGDAASVNQNDTVIYTLTVTNNDSATDATGVTITDPLPAGMSFVSASAGCTFSGGTVTCGIGTVAGGISAQAFITVQVDSPGDITNTASVSADQADPDMTNNTASVVTHVNTPPTISAIADTVTCMNTPVTLTFTVGDAETPAALTVSGVSSNTTLVSNLSFGGAGADRDLVISLASYQSGTAGITVTVSDGQATASTSFILTVNNTCVCNDPLACPGGEVVVTPYPGVTVMFSTVTADGETTATASDVDPMNPDACPGDENFMFLGQCYNIHTTAAYTGDVQICLTYDQASVPPPPFDEASLTFMHWETNPAPPPLETWVNRTISVDTVNNIICGTVSSFSWFAIAVDNAPPTFTLNRLKDTLWPPNHRMVKVATVTNVADNTDPSPAVDIRVSSTDVPAGKDKHEKDKHSRKGEKAGKHGRKHKDKEDDDAEHGGNRHATDWKVRKKGDTWEVWVRAERAGDSTDRIYTITATVTDKAGNQATASHIVKVPHDRRGLKKK